MSPLFISGDYFVCCRWPYTCLKVEDHILVKHATYGYMLKTVRQKTEQGLWLQGHNSNSLSTEKMGLITRQHVIGKVIWHIKKP